MFEIQNNKYTKAEFSDKKKFLLETCLFWSFVWGFMAHGFAYTNFLFNHDGLSMVSDFYGEGTIEIAVGRFTYPLYIFFRGTVNAPWLLGILSNLYVGLATFLISSIFARLLRRALLFLNVNKL